MRLVADRFACDDKGDAVDLATGARVLLIAGTAGGYDIALADGSIWQFGVGDPGTKVVQLAIPVTYQGSSHQRQAAQKAVAVALGQVGTPYVSGGSAPGRTPRRAGSGSWPCCPLSP